VVRDRMRPLRRTVQAFGPASHASSLMDRDGLEFLAVVAPGTGKLVGVVDREVLGRVCPHAGHEAGDCPLMNHVSFSAEFCLEDEALDEWADDHVDREELHLEYPTGPIIVVDEAKRPLGYLPRPTCGAAGLAQSGASTAPLPVQKDGFDRMAA
jgi:hypothetical protein